MVSETNDNQDIAEQYFAAEACLRKAAENLFLTF